MSKILKIDEYLSENFQEIKCSVCGISEEVGLDGYTLEYYCKNCLIQELLDDDSW